MKTALSTGGVPFHHQIAQVLRMRIESGALEGGMTEQALCEEFGVSRTTVRQALGGLKREGLLHSRRGVGTRGVAPRKRPRVVRSAGDPLHAGIDSKPRLVSKGLVPATAEVAAFFAIAAGEPVLRIVRVHVLGGSPLSLVVSYLPAELDKGVSREALRESTHDMLWRRFGLRQKKSVHTLRVARADADAARHLRIGLAEPVLRIQSSVTLDDGRPIRWTENHFREDRYEYVAEMAWPDPAPPRAAHAGRKASTTTTTTASTTTATKGKVIR